MSKIQIRKVGIIGFGNMGLIIGERLNTHAKNYQLVVYDPDTKKTEQITGVEVAQDNLALLGKVDTVIVAIKPQDFEPLLHQIKSALHHKLLISIAAGVATNYIEKHVGNPRVIRVMPNMPARIGKGISCLCKGRFASQADLDFAHELFTYFGETLVLHESLMNGVTAISGSGPGYFYDFILAKGIDQKDLKALENFAWDFFIPELTGIAQKLGFSEEQAKLLAIATAEGSVALLQTTGLSPQTLIAQIASKGGTTEAALEVLHKGGTLEAAINAAKKRSESLSLNRDVVDWVNYGR